MSKSLFRRLSIIVDGKITLTARLSQVEAQALHEAVDRFLCAHLFNELAQEMHEKVVDALTAGGYEPPQPIARD